MEILFPPQERAQDEAKGRRGGVKWPFLGGAVLSYETHLPIFVEGW